jgi:putative drug exporter of the RND superfamily
VFASFALAGPLPVKEMGVVLAVGVLLDTVLVRLVLQPVILRLLDARCRRPPADDESTAPTSSPAAVPMVVRAERASTPQPVGLPESS